MGCEKCKVPTSELWWHWWMDDSTIKFKVICLMTTLCINIVTILTMVTWAQNFISTLTTFLTSTIFAWNGQNWTIIDQLILMHVQ